MRGAPAKRIERSGFKPAVPLGPLMAGFIGLQCPLPLGTAFKTRAADDFGRSKSLDKKVSHFREEFQAASSARTNPLIHQSINPLPLWFRASRAAETAERGQRRPVL